MGVKVRKKNSLTAGGPCTWTDTTEITVSGGISTSTSLKIRWPKKM